MKILKTVLFSLLVISLTSCDFFTDNPISEADIAAGLKEALEVGSENSTAAAHATDGYFANSAIKIFFPKEAEVVESTVRLLPGGNALADDVILKLNRTAEDAADEALPIFVDAIENMTISDALGILNGADTAATFYLESNTRPQLKSAFYPHINTSLTAVGAQQAWDLIIQQYNNIPFVPTVNSDLADHTTEKALDGLFTLIQSEEFKIRTDINARVSDLLREVFGQLDN